MIRDGFIVLPEMMSKKQNENVISLVWRVFFVNDFEDPINIQFFQIP